tara:strand:- start:299 stop:460 length:162 start_codon:yes stop_codon:yes gene_type:complete
MKKYKVSGQWHRNYFAPNLTEANRIAQEDLKTFKNQNVNFNVQNIDEIDNDSD